MDIKVSCYKCSVSEAGHPSRTLTLSSRMRQPRCSLRMLPQRRAVERSLDSWEGHREGRLSRPPPGIPAIDGPQATRVYQTYGMCAVVCATAAVLADVAESTRPCGDTADQRARAVCSAFGQPDLKTLRAGTEQQHTSEGCSTRPLSPSMTSISVRFGRRLLRRWRENDGQDSAKYTVSHAHAFFAANVLSVLNHVAALWRSRVQKMPPCDLHASPRPCDQMLRQGMWWGSKACEWRDLPIKIAPRAVRPSKTGWEKLYFSRS